MALEALGCLNKKQAAHAALANCEAKYKSFRKMLNKRRKVTGEPTSMLRIVDGDASQQQNHP